LIRPEDKSKKPLPEREKQISHEKTGRKLDPEKNPEKERQLPFQRENQSSSAKTRPKLITEKTYAPGKENLCHGKEKKIYCLRMLLPVYPSSSK